MSATAVEKVITRAVKDEAFRTQLFSEPTAALAGYDLTDAEIETLSSLNEDNFDSFAGDLGGRTTQGRWIPGTG